MISIAEKWLHNIWSKNILPTDIFVGTTTLSTKGLFATLNTNSIITLTLC
jgi:hypothetical protein